MKRFWYVIAGVFVLGCLLGYYVHYSRVSDRIVNVPGFVLSGKVEGALQLDRDGSVIGVQLYNGTENHIVVTSVSDSEGKVAEFVQLHTAKPIGRGYLWQGRAVPLHDVISNRLYAVLLPGDNAILKFNDKGTQPVQVQYYSIGDEQNMLWSSEQIKTIKLE